MKGREDEKIAEEEEKALPLWRNYDLAVTKTQLKVDLIELIDQLVGKRRDCDWRLGDELPSNQHLSPA